MSTPPGYLLVYSDPGDKVAQEEFTDWYDNEHVPLRVAVPAFLSCAHLPATSGVATSSSLALYDHVSGTCPTEKSATKT